MFKLAEMFVDIKARDEDLQRQLEGVKGQITRMGVAIGTAVGTMAAGAIARAAEALSGFFRDGLRGAMELQDATSKMNTVFGQSSAIITARAAELAASGKAVKTEYINAATSLGAVFKQAGDSADGAAKMGVQLTNLAMDMRSFEGAGTRQEDVLRDLQSAFAGNYETLRKYRVLLSAEKVEQEAVALGLAKTTHAVTDLAKAQATASLVMKATADQQGDQDRTWTSADNQATGLANTLKNLSQSIGAELIPVFTQVVQAATRMAVALGESFERNKGAIAGWIDALADSWDTVTTGFGALVGTIAQGFGLMGQSIEASTGLFGGFGSFVTTVVDTVSFAWRNFPAILEIAMLQAQQQVLNIQSYFEAFMKNAAIIGGYIASNWRELIVDAVTAVGTAFANLGDNLYRLGAAIVGFLKNPAQGFQFEWKPLLEGFEATAAELPKLVEAQFTDLGPAIQEKLDAIGKTEVDRAKRLVDASAERAKMLAAATTAPAQKQAAKAAAKTKEFKSEASGVSEFALKLRASIYDHQDDVPKKQLEEQRRMERHTRRMAEVLTRGGLVARLA